MKVAVASVSGLLCCAGYLATPALAADGPVVITQASAIAGKVTPGDRPGFPVTITQGGSYRLGSNLQVPANQHGLVIAASNVTLDLDGFTMSGQKAALNGIHILPDPAIYNFAIRNGSVEEFRGAGVNAPHKAFITVESMQIMGNGRSGVVTGGYSQIRDSNVSANSGVGIDCLAYCIVSGNVVAGNTGLGVWLSEGLVLGNTIVANSSIGIRGVNAAAGNNLVSNNNQSSAQQITGVSPLNPNVCIHTGDHAEPC